MKLSDKLKNIRIENNLTMDELVDRLNKKYEKNISKSMISRWENGHSEPLNTFLAIYAREFNIDLNYLLGISDVNTFNDRDNYYYNPETAALAQELHNNPRLCVLMSSSRKTTPDELEALIKIVKGMTDDDD